MTIFILGGPCVVSVWIVVAPLSLIFNFIEKGSHTSPLKILIPRLVGKGYQVDFFDLFQFISR